jgi:hypothetical protein
MVNLPSMANLVKGKLTSEGHNFTPCYELTKAKAKKIIEMKCK